MSCSLIRTFLRIVGMIAHNIIHLSNGCSLHACVCISRVSFLRFQEGNGSSSVEERILQRRQIFGGPGKKNNPGWKNKQKIRHCTQILFLIPWIPGATNLAVVKINMKTKLLTASRQWALITDGIKQSLTASKVKLQSRKMTTSAPNVKTAIHFGGVTQVFSSINPSNKPCLM